MSGDPRIFEFWLAQTTIAVDAMLVWKSWLRAWEFHPNLGQLPVDLFEAVMADMAHSGLQPWLDRPELDELRRALCGGAK